MVAGRQRDAAPCPALNIRSDATVVEIEPDGAARVESNRGRSSGTQDRACDGRLAGRVGAEDPVEIHCAMRIGIRQRLPARGVREGLYGGCERTCGYPLAESIFG